MIFENNLDPDEAPQNVGPHLRSKLFHIQMMDKQNFGFLQVLYLKKKMNLACKGLTPC